MKNALFGVIILHDIPQIIGRFVEMTDEMSWELSANEGIPILRDHGPHRNLIVWS